MLEYIEEKLKKFDRLFRQHISFANLDGKANYLLPDNTVIEDDCQLNLNSVHTMIFSIIGVIIVSLTIPQIFYVIPDIIKMNELTLATQMKTDIIFSIVGVVVKILIGLALIVWSKKLTKLLFKLR